jgi:hypothetical protein
VIDDFAMTFAFPDDDVPFDRRPFAKDLASGKILKMNL